MYSNVPSVDVPCIFVGKQSSLHTRFPDDYHSQSIINILSVFCSCGEQAFFYLCLLQKKVKRTEL